MSRQHQDSIVESGLNHVILETARVINVNMRRWTIDARTVTSQSTFFDVQVGAPYLHFHSGEGMYAMPEVGAKCIVARPSDGPPFVLCFVTAFERAQSSTEEPVEPDQSEDGDNPATNFSAGRPQLQQGDLMLRTRDGNRVYLRRGGVVEIGATEIAKRYYIPLMHYIRDVCENYEMITPGGDMSWKVSRQALTTQAPESSTPVDRDVEVQFTLTGRNYAQDAHATVAMRIGHVDDEARLKLLIAGNAIDPSTLEVTGTEAFSLTINEDGEIEMSNDKDVSLDINGKITLNATSDIEISSGGDIEHTASGDYKVTANSHELRATTSRERISGAKTIESPMIKLGGDGAIWPVAIMTPQFIFWLANHTHPSSGSPPQPTFVPAIGQATKVKAQ